MGILDRLSFPAALALWGGVDSQLERSGHAARTQDLERFASLGVRAIRYPVPLDRTAPDGIAVADWSWPDERLPALRQLGVTPIAGFVHHGCGPRHTSLMDPQFANELARFAGAVARRYPWLEYYTPVTEPLATARAHGRADRTFVQALLNQCRAVVLSMAAVRRVNPLAQLIQTDELSKHYGTPEMAPLAAFLNARRWLGWDLLCGKVGPSHPLWDELARTGVDVGQLLWFRDHPCPPDIIGVNYHPASERWLDHRVEGYPARFHSSDRGTAHADIDTARVLATPTPGIAPLLRETWERYRLPVAVTDTHIDARREDQLRWLLEIWEACHRERDQGADIRAVTVGSLLGCFDWNCLVSQGKRYCEPRDLYAPGPFDARSAPPRATALATLVRELATGRPLSSAVVQGHGWWRRPGRFLAAPVATRSAVADLAPLRNNGKTKFLKPILITGASGTLGAAFARLCEKRNLAYRVVRREEMELADPASVENAIRRYRPWAIINAAGYARVDQAEADAAQCFRDNTLAAKMLALASLRHDLRLVTFSSDLVFDGISGINGARRMPYVESDRPAPLSVYGQSKAEAERCVLDINPQALVVRTSAFFSPWDEFNFVAKALRKLASGQAFAAASDSVFTPTYVPDLVHTVLDLLIDKEGGLWHLSNATALSWAQLARAACDAAGISPSTLRACPMAELPLLARRPAYSALSSERACLLPPLDDALERYLNTRAEHRAELQSYYAEQ